MSPQSAPLQIVKLFTNVPLERREHYGIIAKTIEEKETLREKGYHAFDLEDFETNMYM